MHTHTHAAAILLILLLFVISGNCENKTIYTAVFLEDASRAAVLEAFPRELLQNVYAEHTTIKFAPSDSEVKHLPVGRIVPLYAILWASDGSTCQGMQVVSPEIKSANQYPHVTISTANDTGAVCTNNLLSKLHNNETKDIESGNLEPNLVLYGCVDTFPRSGLCEKSSSRFPSKTIVKKTPLDWFDFSNTKMFDQRMLIWDGFWNRTEGGGPLLFFFGGEGKLEDFYENSGVLFELAARVRSLGRI